MDRAPNQCDKGIRKGTPDPWGTSNAVLPLVAEGCACGSGGSSYGSGSCMMVVAVPSG